jgi:hypothetical protein
MTLVQHGDDGLDHGLEGNDGSFCIGSNGLEQACCCPDLPAGGQYHLRDVSLAW